MASLTTVLGLVGSVAVATLSFNDTFAAHPSHNSRKANVVRVIGEDFKFDAPDIIPAGLTEFRF
ncbi:MAG: hypothetical protein ACJ77Q_00020, partial [Gemmatimonadaceae bacterium]